MTNNVFREEEEILDGIEIREAVKGVVRKKEAVLRTITRIRLLNRVEADPNFRSAAAISGAFTFETNTANQIEEIAGQRSTGLGSSPITKHFMIPKRK